MEKEQVEQKVYLSKKPKQGCQLNNYYYYFKMLEPEVAAEVSVPFEEMQKAIMEQKPNSKEESVPVKSKNKLNQVLDEYGFAIIPDALSSIIEVETMKSLFGKDLLSIISKPESDPMKVAEVAADPINNFPMDQVSLGYMFCADLGLPHGRLAWYVRTHPRIKKIFATIYEDEELCTGMDNLFFSNLPPEVPPWEIEVQKVKESPAEKKKQEGSEIKMNEKGKKKSDEDDYNENLANISKNLYGEKLWPHVDQNMLLFPEGSWREFQSALYVTEVNEYTSATVVWPKSHNKIPNIMFNERGMKFRGHYCPIPNDLNASFVENAGRVPVPAGGLLIWDSRQVHQGWNNGPRLAVPICLEPKARRPLDRIELKKKLIRKGAPSTHWASIFIQHDLGYNDRTRDSRDKKLRVFHEAHQFLFGLDKTKENIPKEILELL